MAGDAGNVRMSGFAVRTYGALDDALFFAGNGPVDGGKLAGKAVTQSFVDFANGACVLVKLCCTKAFFAMMTRPDVSLSSDAPGEKRPAFDSFFQNNG